VSALVAVEPAQAHVFINTQVSTFRADLSGVGVARACSTPKNPYSLAEPSVTQAAQMN
jgi:hypothetical protein